MHAGHPDHPGYPVPALHSVLQGRVYHRFGIFYVYFSIAQHWSTLYMPSCWNVSPSWLSKFEVSNARYEFWKRACGTPPVGRDLLYSISAPARLRRLPCTRCRQFADCAIKLHSVQFNISLRKEEKCVVKKSKLFILIILLWKWPPPLPPQTGKVRSGKNLIIRRII